ncbi:MAG TPA: hypothetical protein VEE82_01640 [Thermodesulfovibrionales bacterium]|nr:hypothetical protein [Thermodesulfovibrionales bacterium]
MGMKKGRDKQAEEASSSETENSLDALDRINADLGFVIETLKLVEAASLGRKEWPDMSLIHVIEEMLVRLERAGKLCNLFLVHSSKDRRV